MIETLPVERMKDIEKTEDQAMENTNILEMKNITKVYSTGLMANDHVNFSLKKGEIHALAGENGAGKTTLMKVLFGLEKADEGKIFLNGEEALIQNPIDAIRKGIGMVHQHFMLIPSLTVAENIVLGDEPGRHGIFDMRAARKTTEEIGKKYHMEVDPDIPVYQLPVGIRQKVEILKALHKGAQILILDEPTAVLAPQETKELFTELKGLRSAGHTIVFISHKLNEIKELCDRITILRDGKDIGVYNLEEISEQKISSLMVGRNFIPKINKKPFSFGKVILDVQNVEKIEENGKKILNGISFQVHEGEIVGIAGVEGNGQRELAEAVTGLTGFDKGEISISGEIIKGKSVRKIREIGTAHVSDDRLVYGVVGEASVNDNLITYVFDKKEYTKYGLQNKRKLIKYAETLIRGFLIKSKDGQEAVRMLSGGNIQKVVVAREFSTSPKLIVLNQPTRGIDVGAAELVRQKTIELSRKGTAVLLVSADLNELFELSDRLLVMYNGKITADIQDVHQVTEHELGEYMLGLKEGI